MIKFINKLVAGVNKLKNFFNFILAFQKGLTAFSEEWTRLTGQKIEDILQETDNKNVEA